MNWLKKIIREELGLAYTTIGSLGSSLLGALLWLILASILTVENYGLVNYYIAVATIAATTTILGLNTTITAYLAKGEEKLTQEANSLTLILGLASAIILSPFQWTSAILSATTIFFNMTLAETLGRKNYQEYALLAIGQRTAQITLSLILYYQIGILGIILGYILGNLIFSYRFFQSIKKFTLKFNNLKEKRNFAFHSYGFNLTRTLTTYLDKIIIASLFGYHTLGLYQLGFQFFMFLSMIPASLYQYILPEESGGKNKEEIKIVGLTLSAILAITASITAPYIIEKLFPTFVEATQIVQIMSLAIIPSTIALVQTASLLAKENSRKVFASGIIYLASIITGLSILGRIMDITGLAFAVLIAQIIQAAYLTIKID